VTNLLEMVLGIQLGQTTYMKFFVVPDNVVFDGIGVG